MATVSIASLGLGNADLTVIGKLSETGLSQIEVADAVVEGDKLKKGNITANQVGAYSKIEVDNLLANIDIDGALTDYYDKTETDSLVDIKQDTLVSGTNIKTINGQSVLGNGNIEITGEEVDLTNYYTKSETYNKVETNLLVDAKQDNLVSGTSIKTINGQSVLGNGNIEITSEDVDLTNYYDKTETYNKVETNLLVDAKQDNLVSGTSIKTINGQSVLGSGDIIITSEDVDLTNYYTKSETDSLVGEKGDTGDTGNGIVNILFTSTTDPSGLAGQSGATDTYTITYSDTTTDTIQSYNGLDSAVQSVAGRVGNVVLTEADITDIDKYTKAEVDAKINAKHSTAFLMAYSN